MEKVTDKAIKTDLARIFVEAMTSIRRGPDTLSVDHPDVVAFLALFIAGVSAGAALRDVALQGQIERSLIRMMGDLGFKPKRINMGGQPPPHE